MIKMYTRAFPHKEWASAYDFLKDALSLTSDKNFNEYVKIIKMEKNGYLLDFCIDGELYCYTRITVPEKPIKTYCKQGIAQYKNVSVDEFVKLLEKELDLVRQESSGITKPPCQLDRGGLFINLARTPATLVVGGSMFNVPKGWYVMKQNLCNTLLCWDSPYYMRIA